METEEYIRDISMFLGLDYEMPEIQKMISEIDADSSKHVRATWLVKAVNSAGIVVTRSYNVADYTADEVRNLAWEGETILSVSINIELFYKIF